MLISNAFNLGWLLVASLSFTNTVSALPSDIRATELIPRALDENDPFTWDTAYIKKKLIKKIPDKDSCIFYSSGLTNLAVDWAAANKGTTVYDVYDCDAVFNPAKFPFKNFVQSGNGDQRRVWFKITSRAFAEVCSGITYLVIKSGTAVPTKAIWNEDEYDAIKKGDSGIKIDDVYVLDPSQKPPVKGKYDPAPGAIQTPKDPVLTKAGPKDKARREISEASTPVLAERAPVTSIITRTVIPIPLQTTSNPSGTSIGSPGLAAIPKNCPIIE